MQIQRSKTATTVTMNTGCFGIFVVLLLLFTGHPIWAIIAFIFL